MGKLLIEPDCRERFVPSHEPLSEKDSPQEPLA